MGICLKNEKGLSAGWENFHAFSLSQAQAAIALLSAPSSSVGSTQAQAAIAALTPFLETDRRGDVKFVPGGWNNSTQVADASLADIKAEWQILRQLDANKGVLASIVKTINATEKNKNEWSSRYVEPAALPSVALMNRLDESALQSLGADEFAQAGSAFAIWMADPSALGYMDTKKRPAGAAGARLFESAAAAARTARAAGFGKNRGAAVIVELSVEPTGIEPLSDQATELVLDPVRSVLAKIEREELQDAIEQSSLERLRRVLAEHEGGGIGIESGHEQGSPVAAERTSLSSATDLGKAEPAETALVLPTGQAGAQKGWALWTQSANYQQRDANGNPVMHYGFEGQRAPTGPLIGANLHTTQPSAWHGQSAAIRVQVRPMRIHESIVGEQQVADDTHVHNAIQLEQEARDLAALRRAGEQQLRERVAALELEQKTPEATPAAAPRRRRL